MLVIKVELWPHEDATDAKPLGIIAIRGTGSVGAMDADLHGYQVELQRDNGWVSGRRVTHWRRRGWLRLVKLALEALDNGTS